MSEAVEKIRLSLCFSSQWLLFFPTLEVENGIPPLLVSFTTMSLFFHFPYREEGYLKVVVQCRSFTLHSTNSSLLASKPPSMKKLILKTTINKKARSV